VRDKQGSVETLFRRGGKCLYDFATDLFEKRRTKFGQNRLSFIKESTVHVGLFVPDSVRTGQETNPLHELLFSDLLFRFGAHRGYSVQVAVKVAVGDGQV